MKIIALLLLSASAFAQNFALNDASTYSASRIGINIGAENYYNAYLGKNLIKANPSMQNQLVRQIKQAASGSTTGFVSNNDYDGVLANGDVGWTFIVSCHGGQGASPGTCAGGALGQTGTISANTVNSGSTTFTFSSAISTAIVANDSIWLFSPTSATTAAGYFTWPDFGWGQSLSGSGTAVIDTTGGDLPPTLNGFATANQCVKLAVTGGGDSAGVYTYFDTSGSLNYTFNGTFTQGVQVKVLSGTPTLTMSVVRSGGINSSAATSPTGGYTTVSRTFTGSETTATAGGNVQISYTLTAASAASICLVGASLTNNADNSSTTYRNQTITNLQFLNPGEVRYNSDGQQGTSLINWITPMAYRRPSGVTGDWNGVTPTQQGLHDFLTLQQSLGTPRVSIAIPPTWSATDWSNLTDYLAGSSGTTYGGYRASLGQTAAWTTVFSKIILEVGNEPWNTTLDIGQASYPQYSVSSTAYWNYIYTANNACAAGKANGNWNSTVMKCGAGVLTAQGATHAGYILAAGSSIDLQNGNEYGMFTPTTCTNPAIFTSAFVEAYANTLSGSASGFYQMATGGVPAYVYEYNNSTNAGSCTQAQLNGYPEGQGYGLTNTLMPLWANKTLGITDYDVWQMYQPTAAITTSGGATSLNEWGIFTGPGGSLTAGRGTAYAMNTVNGCIGTGSGYAVTPSSVSTFNFTSSNGVNSVSNVPYLQPFAFTSGTNRCLLVENIDPTNPYIFTVSGTNVPTGTVTQTKFTSTNLTDNNEGVNATPINFNTVSSGAAPANYTVPAHSIIAVAWTTSAPPVGAGGSISSGKVRKSGKFRRQ